MASSVAYISIILWPLVVFFLMKKKGAKRGIFVSVLISYLFLPANFEINFPGIPAFDKATTTVISILLFLFFVRKPLGFSSLTSFAKFVIFCYILSPILTSLTNSETYLHIPGVSLYDGLSQAVLNLLAFFPFILGVRYFSDYKSQVLLIKAFVIFSLIYSIFILYEIRMSPQLHTMLYGYFPHSFDQQYRSGGFRAVVFMGHGLLVALFVAVSLAFATALTKAKISIFNTGIKNWVIVLFLFCVLVLSKSYAALIFGFSAYVIIYFFKIKKIYLISISFAFLYLSYPFLSANHIFPHKEIVNIAESINPSRASSLAFRFYHEDQLLSHANEKPLFGWGSWGRNRVYDPETYVDLSVTDGRWIIVLGSRGWFGFLAEFYFIMMAIFLSAKASKVLNNSSGNPSQNQAQILLASHTLVVSIILIDQLPNSSLNYFYWLLVGALYGRARDIITASNLKS